MGRKMSNFHEKTGGDKPHLFEFLCCIESGRPNGVSITAGLSGSYCPSGHPDLT